MWEAFRGYVMFLLEQQADDIAFSDVIFNPDFGTSLFQAENRRAFAAAKTLAERARDAGVIRSDFDPTDLFILGYANAGLVRRAQPVAPLAWKRFGEYMLQAFRAPAGGLEPAATSWPQDSTGGSRS